MNLVNKSISKRFIIEEHPLIACLLYLLASFFAQLFVSNVFYAMCLVNLTFFIYVFIRKTIHPITKPQYGLKTIVISLIAVIILLVTTYLWSRWYMSTIADSASLAYVQTMSSSDIYVYLFMIGIAAPLGEESLFRYIIINGFMKMFSKFKDPIKYTLSIVFSAVIFAVMHGTGVHLFVGFFCGLALAIVYITTNKLSIAIVIHSFYNIGTLFLYVPLSLSLCIVFTIISFLLVGFVVYNLCTNKLLITSE